MERIYLDNAATSWPKPPEVLTAIQDFYANLGSASGRGSQASPFSSDQLVRQCRKELAEFINAGTGDTIVFAFSGTDAIQVALNGVLRAGDHVVTTEIDHNSVLRPLHLLQAEQRITFDVVPTNHSGIVNVSDIESAIQSSTRLVVLSHASNVTGAVQEIAKVAEVCKTRGVVFMIDAAQTLGHLPIDCAEIGCDLLVAPGHKGLMGPLGTGLVFISGRVESQMRTWRAGGTGSRSESLEQPQELPGRLEAGNLNVGGIAGVLAGVRWIQRIGVAEIASRESSQISHIRSSLEEIDGVRLLGEDLETQVGVVSFEVQGQDPRDVAMVLESSFGIQTRAGLHCAPLIHKRIGTFARGGSVRVSPGWMTTTSQVEQFLNAVREIAMI